MLNQQQKTALEINVGSIPITRSILIYPIKTVLFRSYDLQNRPKWEQKWEQIHPYQGCLGMSLMLIF
jgi:hypothetical protein